MASNLIRIDDIDILRHHNKKLDKPCLPVRTLQHSTGYITIDPEKVGSKDPLPPVVCYECGRGLLNMVAKTRRNTKRGILTGR